MADDELAGLSHEELLELVRRQQAELAARDEKIRELEEELAQCRRPAKTPENSWCRRRVAGSRTRSRGGGSWARSAGTSE